MTDQEFRLMRLESLKLAVQLTAVLYPPESDGNGPPSPGDLTSDSIRMAKDLLEFLEGKK